jgi:voltage-gated potassium channel
MARRESLWVHVVRSLGVLVSVLLIYYGFPESLALDSRGEFVGVALFLAGIAGLGWLVVVQIRRAGEASDVRGRFMGVLTVVYLVVGFFSLVYYLIERRDPEQFVGLETRTDSLYYTVVTLGTVGFGDVHAVGQLGRISTVVQIVFDVVLLGALLGVASSSLSRRLATPKEPDADPPVTA